jgi:uncharacterized protein YbaR (Trm112 family)
VSNPVRTAVETAARDLLAAVAGISGPVTMRVAATDGRRGCLVLVWEGGEGMPTVGGERRSRDGGRRAGCRRDILAAVQEAGCPLTRRQLVRVLRERGTPHGPGTVAKALAELTATGELVNPRDRRGYRLPDWPKPPRTPSLFD